ncbi:bifunctional N-acetylglucosamine-1-phosphate uridyltransferase/glucosamine-1-phosphate acetyltransferase [bacterium]|nr:bifunctional N-acetylglucosamine-1-phosphate uridyltransferase/glucosamine-1-phosphate acetyltransferase [bacterium]
MENKINAVILAAGKGTRMKSDKSKVLHEIMGKPLLGYVLDAIKKTEIIEKSYVIVGHQAESVETYVKNTYENAQAVLQTPQLGTGHAVSMVCPYMEDFKGEVVILCGDTPLVTAETLKAFIEHHRALNSDITVMSAVFDDPTNYGRIIRKGENLAAIVEEKDATSAQKKIKEVNAGIYCLNWEKVKGAFSQLKNNNAQGEYYLTDIISWGVENGLNTNVYTIDDVDEIFGINSKTHLAQASAMLKDKIIQKHLDNGVTIVDINSVWISEDTQIGADTIIFPNVYISGKNIIGKNCKIGPFAHLRGNVELGENVKIGNYVEVKNSTIASNSNACHLSYIGDTEIGSNVNFGAGAMVANYNHFTKKKLKTIIKDGVSVGGNSVLIAPVTLGECCSIGASSVITKDVEARSLALTRPELKTVENYIK